MSKQWQSPRTCNHRPQKELRSLRMETNKGTIEIELFADAAPVTVNNFVFPGA
ncbi:MAG: peptidylprolyl isomerase [Chloroflexota bacterium]